MRRAMLLALGCALALAPWAAAEPRATACDPDKHACLVTSHATVGDCSTDGNADEAIQVSFFPDDTGYAVLEAEYSCYQHVHDGWQTSGSAVVVTLQACHQVAVCESAGLAWIGDHASNGVTSYGSCDTTVFSYATSVIEDLGCPAGDAPHVPYLALL